MKDVLLVEDHVELAELMTAFLQRKAAACTTLHQGKKR